MPEYNNKMNRVVVTPPSDLLLQIQCSRWKSSTLTKDILYNRMRSPLIVCDVACKASRMPKCCRGITHFFATDHWSPADSGKCYVIVGANERKPKYVLEWQLEYINRIPESSFCKGCLMPFYHCYCPPTARAVEGEWLVTDSSYQTLPPMPLLTRKAKTRVVRFILFPEPGTYDEGWEPLPLHENEDHIQKMHRRQFYKALAQPRIERQSSDDSVATTRVARHDLTEPAVVEQQGDMTRILSEQEDMEPIVKVCEDVGTLMRYLQKAECFSDCLMAFQAFVRSFTGRSVVYLSWDMAEFVTKNLEQFFIQQSDNTHWTEELDNLWNHYDQVAGSLLAKKMKKVVNHTVAHCVYHKMGIAVDPILFAQIEKEQIRPSLISCSTFAIALGKLITFLLKQGRQALLLGSLQPLFIDGTTVSAWITRVKKLKADSEFVGNPQAVGFSIFEYLSNLNEAYEEGKAVAKVVKGGSMEYKFVQAYLIELDTLRRRHLTVTFAQCVRKQPFAVCIYGTPGIGKSSVLEAIWHTLCRALNLKPDPGLKFQHCADDEYMTNFRSYMHTIVLDDVAQQNPAKIQGVDPSVSLVMRIINTQPLSPPQAALDDKGKTPVLSDLVIATTNTLDMNLPQYFPNSYAAMRRFPVHIEPIVKPEFGRMDSSSEGVRVLDSEKAAKHIGFPDFWKFVIRKPVQKAGQRGVFAYVTTINSMAELLQYIIPIARKHMSAQEAFLRAANEMKDMKLCTGCEVPEQICVCDNSIAPDSVVVPDDPSLSEEEDSFCERCTKSFFNGDTCKCAGWYKGLEQQVDSAPAETFSPSELARILAPQVACYATESSTRFCSRIDSVAWRVLSSQEYDEYVYHRDAVMRIIVGDLAIKSASAVISGEKGYNDGFFEPAPLVIEDTSSSEGTEENPEFWDDELKELSDATGFLPWEDKEVPIRKPRIATPAVVAALRSRLVERGMLLTEVDEFLGCHLGRELARGKTVKEIIADGLRWQEAKLKEASQEYADTFDLLDEIEDEAAQKLHGSPWYDRAIAYVISATIRLYFEWGLVKSAVDFFARRSYVRRLVLRKFRRHLIRAEHAKAIARGIGTKIDQKLSGGSQWVRVGLALSTLLVTVMTVAGVIVLIRGKSAVDTSERMATPGERREEPKVVVIDGKDSEDLDNEPSSEEVKPQMDSKGCQTENIPHLQARDLRAVGKMPPSAASDSVKNVWVREERCVTALDFSPKRPLHLEPFVDKLTYNVLRYEFRTKDEKGTFDMRSTMFVVCDGVILVNAHALPEEDQFVLKVYLGGRGKVSPIQELQLNQSQVTRYNHRDMAIIQTKGLVSVFKTVLHAFPKVTYNGTGNGFYLLRGKDGSVTKLKVNCIERHSVSLVAGLKYPFVGMAWVGYPEEPTKTGDCGSPLVMETGYGPVVVGFHFAYHAEPGRSYAVAITDEDVSFCPNVSVQVGKIELYDKQLVEKDTSFIDFHEDGRMFYHGEIEGWAAKFKGSSFHTELWEYLHGKDPEFFGDFYTCPPTHRWRPQQLALGEFMHPARGFDEVIVEKCAQAFLEHILNNLPQDELDLIVPVNIDVAVNGMPGMAYVDPIKRSTSMGFPFNKSKKGFLESLNNPLWADGVKFDAEIEKDILRVYELMLEGVRPHCIFSSNLKDEPISHAKALIFKIRTFFKCPVALLVVVRMLTLSFCRVVQRNPFVFKCAVGINCHSREWDAVHAYLREVGDKFIAGDYRFYDKKIPVVVMKWVWWIVKEICRASGHYSDEELLALDVLAAEMSSATIEFFQMIVTLIGGEVSGHQMTTIINCFINVMLLMYMWVENGRTPESFFELLRLIVLGDDHLVAVHESVEDYNLMLLARKFDEKGMGYTSADKSEATVPFDPIEKVTFLKRTFRYMPELGSIVGPLDRKSIAKMLMIQTASKAVCREEQLAQAMVAASMEAFYHGKEFFSWLNKLLDDFPHSKALRVWTSKYPRFTWEQNLMRYMSGGRKYLEPAQAALDPCRSQMDHLVNSDCCDEVVLCPQSQRMDLQDNSTRAIPKIPIQGRVWLNSFKTIARLKSIGLRSLAENNQPAAVLSNKQLNNVPSNDTETGGNQDTKQQQTQFVHESIPHTLDLAKVQPMIAKEQLIDADLAGFLSRPARIYAYTWTENSAAGLKTSFAPWNIYMTLPEIASKLSTFKYFRGDLCVKFTINASPFYYGALGAFYRPLSINLPDTSGLSLGYAAGAQVLTSQQPHVWLDPQSTTNAEIKLPFLYHKNFVDLSLQQNLSDLGVMQLMQYAALRSANGVTTTGVTVVVYAWLENVQLAGATSRPILQSEKEYVPNGQISGPASTVASVASRLTDAPVIGPFAKATETVAGAVASVADYFGYTNVPNVEDVRPYKPFAFGHLASSQISEPIAKLSLQPKQETTVSSMSLGDPTEDNLVINSLCSRESFLCGAQWTTSNAENDVLFTSAVTPELYEYDGTNPSYYAIYSTPMHYASRFFAKWRGGIKFRFKFIRSTYHRGRVNICWDVGVTAANNMPAAGKPSVYNVVVDLDETDEAVIRVPYIQDFPFLQLQSSEMDVPLPYWSNGPTPTFSHSGNGTIQMRVINRLTAPEATSDVDVLVFVSACDDIEFHEPRNMFRDFTLLQPQSEKEYVDREITMGPYAETDDKVLNEIYGEKIVSFRELLHRQSKAWTQVQPQTGSQSDWSGNNQTYVIPIKRIPRVYGYSSGGWDVANKVITTPGTYAFNYVRNHPLPWIVACFIGFRGSVNYTINVRVSNGTTAGALPNSSVSVCRQSDQTDALTAYQPCCYTTADTNNQSNLARNLNNRATKLDKQGASGMFLTSQITNAGVSVNLPYYSRSRMMYSDFTSYYGSTAVPNANRADEAHKDTFEVSILRRNATNTADYSTVVDFYAGTGPDFDVVFFLNCPVCWKLTAPTTP